MPAAGREGWAGNQVRGASSLVSIRAKEGIGWGGWFGVPSWLCALKIGRSFRTAHPLPGSTTGAYHLSASSALRRRRDAAAEIRRPVADGGVRRYRRRNSGSRLTIAGGPGLQ